MNPAMRFRVGFTDVCAALVVVAAVLVPSSSSSVENAYMRVAQRDAALVSPAVIDRMSALQSQIAADPTDAKAAAELAGLLERIEQHDHALRVAGRAATADSPHAWRASLAVASAHAERIRYLVVRGDGVAEELQGALTWTTRAAEQCQASRACSDDDRIRLMLYQQVYQRGVDAIAGGLDPKKDPEGFLRAIRERGPTVRVGGPTGDTPAP